MPRRRHVPERVIVATESGNVVPGLTRDDGGVDIGEACAYCGADTSAGSGLYVNRVPADWQRDASSPTLSGFICAECQTVSCDECGAATLDYTMRDAGGVVCDDCAERAA